MKTRSIWNVARLMTNTDFQVARMSVAVEEVPATQQ